MNLLEYARSLGVPMRAIHAGRHIGWTTNPDVVQPLKDAGATVMVCRGVFDTDVQGWEVSFLRTAFSGEDAQATKGTES